MKKLTEFSINYDADTIEDCKDYMNYRNLQLSKFGLRVDNIIEHEWGMECQYKNAFAFFIMKSFRGHGLYKKLAENKMIVTLEECKIIPYLVKHNIDFYPIQHTPSYKVIQTLYGDDRAIRSGIPLIYHIEEGVAILTHLKAVGTTKDAFCLHPILQSDEDFTKHKIGLIPKECIDAAILAMEYRHVANSYLSHHDVDDFVGFSCPEVKQMLIADKVQNYKDFLLYHKNTHERSNELDTYFNNWFRLLDIDYNEIVKIIEQPSYHY